MSPDDWSITIQRSDKTVKIIRFCLNDELEFTVDEALADARREESKLNHPGGKSAGGAVV